MRSPIGGAPRSAAASRTIRRRRTALYSRICTPLARNEVYPDLGEATWKNFSWKVGLEADAARDSMLYANVSTGYKAGGLNEGLSSPPYRPEELTAFALGSKNRL